MIFAAGLGTRLRPLTNDRPKALVEVAGRTLLEHTILRLRDAGFTRIVVNVHHFADQIIEFLRTHDNFGLDIRVSDERGALLDTGGGIRHAYPLLDPDEPLLIHNVDIVSDIDLPSLIAAHEASLPDVTLAINKRTTSRYLMFDVQRHLCGWTNVKTGEVRGQIGERYAFAGIHILGPRMLQRLAAHTEEAFPIIPFYIDACTSLTLVGHDVTAARWVDCGKPESLDVAARILTSITQSKTETEPSKSQ